MCMINAIQTLTCRITHRIWGLLECIVNVLISMMNCFPATKLVSRRQAVNEMPHSFCGTPRDTVPQKAVIFNK